VTPAGPATVTVSTARLAEGDLVAAANGLLQALDGPTLSQPARAFILATVRQLFETSELRRKAVAGFEAQLSDKS
jgi:hypothetical protein